MFNYGGDRVDRHQGQGLPDIAPPSNIGQLQLITGAVERASNNVVKAIDDKRKADLNALYHAQTLKFKVGEANQESFAKPGNTYEIGPNQEIIVKPKSVDQILDEQKVIDQIAMQNALAEQDRQLAIQRKWDSIYGGGTIANAQPSTETPGIVAIPGISYIPGTEGAPNIQQAPLKPSAKGTVGPDGLPTGSLTEDDLKYISRISQDPTKKAVLKYIEEAIKTQRKNERESAIKAKELAETKEKSKLGEQGKLEARDEDLAKQGRALGIPPKLLPFFSNMVKALIANGESPNDAVIHAKEGLGGLSGDPSVDPEVQKMVDDWGKQLSPK